MTDRYDIEELKKECIEELKDAILEYDSDPYDLMSEIADSNVPVYNWDLLEYAQNDLWLSCETPDILAFDGTPTAVNCIAGTIYQELYSAMNQVLDDILEEKENQSRCEFCQYETDDLDSEGHCPECREEEIVT